MTNSYDATKDPFPHAYSGPAGFGRRGRAVTPSDSTDLDPYARAIVVSEAGDLVILPTENDDADTITFTDCPVGFTPPYQVRRVLATGTTASVATVD